MNFDDYVEMFLYFNTILPPAAVRLNRMTKLGLTPSLGCHAIQLHGFVSIIATRFNCAVNDNYNGMPEAAQAKTMTRAAIDGNLTELNLGGIRQTASELALHSLAQGFKPNDDYEKMQFYYHPDHLGSSSYITNLDGEVSQHIEYVPFGEVFIEERNNTWNTPYLFNAKEFDEETGMYYYGARYYDPRLSLWMSVDRFAEKYPATSGYNYAINNPVRYIDINGDSIRVSSENRELFNKTLKDVFGEFSSKFSYTQSDMLVFSGENKGMGKAQRKVFKRLKEVMYSKTITNIQYGKDT